MAAVTTWRVGWIGLSLGFFAEYVFVVGCDDVCDVWHAAVA